MILTVSPMDPTIITHIVPMGRMHGDRVTPTDHMYIYHDRPHVYPPPYDVKSPADGRIVSIQAFPFRRVSSGLLEDYRVILEHSCDVFTVFIHLGGLPKTILDQTGPIPEDSNWYPSERYPPVPVEAGQVVGKVGSMAIDFSLHDATVTLPGFVIPAHYEGEAWKIHTVDPFDYFTEPIRKELLKKNPRTAEPRGGKIDYDIDGRLVGNWFLEGTEGYADKMSPEMDYWTGHLAIAYDHYDPTQIQISIGGETGMGERGDGVGGSVYGVKGNVPDPAGVSVETGLVKYELVGRMHVGKHRVRTENVERRVLGVFLVKMMDDRTLQVEVIPGRRANGVRNFSRAARMYHR